MTLKSLFTIGLTFLFITGCNATAQTEDPSTPAQTSPTAVTVATATPASTATPTASPTPIDTPQPPTPTNPPAPTTTPTNVPIEAAPQPADTLPTPTLFNTAWQDRATFAAGLIQSEQAVLDELPGATVYHINLEIGDPLTNLTGQEELLYTNQEDVPLNQIYFRLFPNIASGTTGISNLTLNGEPVEPLFELQNSAMRVDLPAPLEPGEQVVITMDFEVIVPGQEGGNYGTFAFLDDVLALAHFYPMVAVYDDEGWNVEIAPYIGDVVYADSSFYRVRVSAPAEQTLAASGIELERQNSDDRQIVTYAAGPTRDFYLAASHRFDVISRTIGQTTINSYAPAELMDGAEIALDYAESALRSFETRFGPYPFTEFDLVSTTTFALGVEYPGIVAILVDMYDPGSSVANMPASALMEAVVAHEVAHQWFYSAIGNDQVDEPWVDEAMAQYATLLYYEDVYGTGDGFRGSLERRWQRVDRADIPVGLPVRDYSEQEYGAIVYGRGPLFVETLAQEMGPAAFADFLQAYYRQYRWGIATGEDFKQLAEETCACDLTPLFEAWVYPKK